jgi:hypothetical protein
MNKDTTIAELDCINNDGEIVFNGVNILGNVPFWLRNLDIDTWISNRRAPSNRKYANIMFSGTGIWDRQQYIDKTKAISLNDTLWVKRKNENITWNDINPYINPLNKIVSQLAFGCIVNTGNIGSPSPELSTGGSFAKCWKRVNGDICMLKMGRNEWLGEYDNEPFSKYFTAQIAERLGIKRHAEYRLGTSKGRTITYSKLFTSEKIGLVTMAQVFGGFSATFKDAFNYIRRLGVAEELLFRQMMVLDSLTFNNDRHFNNFGLFVDNNTFDTIGMASIYDNNIALLPTLILNSRSRQEILSDIKDVHPKYYESFYDLANESITDEIAQRLFGIASNDFKLEQDDRVKLDNKRLKFLEDFVRFNVMQILKSGVYL